MSISEKRIEEFEKQYRKEIFDRINEICSIQAEEIILMGKNAEITEQLISDIPNLGIRLNNKLNELSQTFNKAGISMYSRKVEDIDTVTSSFIGEAILSVLVGYLSQATKKLQEYDKKSEEVIKEKIGTSLATVKPIKRFFTKIKYFFSLVPPVDMSLTEEEKTTLKEPLDEYTDINDKIWKYNLKDNVIDSIVKHIHDTGYAAFTVPDLLEECVVPDLQKLGLGDIIPELQSKLIEVYKKDALNLCITEQEMGIYIPNFNRETHDNLQIEQDDNEVPTERPEKIDTSTPNALRGKGITQEELDVIDRIINSLEEEQPTGTIEQKDDEQEEDR